MEKEELRINEEALARRAKSKPAAKKSTVELVPKFCKGCGLCINICPTGTLLFHDDPENKWGVAVVVDAPENCIGCRQCENQCPDCAIFAYRDTGKKDESERKAV